MATNMELQDVIILQSGSGGDQEPADLSSQRESADIRPFQKKASCSEKLLKVVFAVCLFILISICISINKISLYIMVSQIRQVFVGSNTTCDFSMMISSRCTFSNMNVSTNLTRQHTVSNQRCQVDPEWIWAIYFVIISPYILIVLVNLVKVFNSKKDPSLKCPSLFLAICIETLQSVGICLAVFLVMPTVDPVTFIILPWAVGIIPSIVDFIDTLMSYKQSQNYDQMKNNNENKQSKIGSLCFSVLNGLTRPFVVICQIIGLVSLSLYSKEKLVLVLAVVFMSLKYFENFVDYKPTATGAKWYLSAIKQNMHECRMHVKATLMISLWKIMIPFFAIVVFTTVKSNNTIQSLRALFRLDDAIENKFTGSDKLVIDGDSHCRHNSKIVLPLINVISGFLCYFAAKASCRIHCQHICFVFPLIVSPLVGMAFFELVRSSSVDDFRIHELNISDWAEVPFLNPYAVTAYSLLYFSFIILTRYNWRDGCLQGETSRLFVTNLYSGVLLDVSILLNRRRKDDEYDDIKQNIELQTNHNVRETSDANTNSNVVPMIYACVTMWHENKREMTQLLRSVMRMAKDCSREKIYEEQTENKKKRLYDFEAHVFFDDAFDKPGYPHENSHVQCFHESVKEAGCEEYWKDFDLQPHKYATPYGGRIEWKLPSEIKLILHLKDKTKIRNKKRWSQVMYMNYVLKFTKDINNTFILALDGDVDFQPDAVKHLLRRMNKNKKIGAACGRIHPIGDAFSMVTCQKFEYAVSHWLQKATEHVFGSVLCSPGCFSLFRCTAFSHMLNGKTILGEYSSTSNNPIDSIQHDQGEDRWLSTLLLKYGYTIEYCAESDAYTYAPEGFDEFFKQRRRWIPSTLANIFDLLSNWKEIRRNNYKINFVYIFYHAALCLTSILAPGTIFMMLVGALMVMGMNPIGALVLHSLFFGLFILNYFIKQGYQIRVAKVLSLVYCIIMLVVLIGIFISIIKEGIFSTSVLYQVYTSLQLYYTLREPSQRYEDDEETSFWKEILKGPLKPVQHANEDDRPTNGMKSLRNKCFISILLTNIGLIVLISVLTINHSVRSRIAFTILSTNITVDPISFLFTAVFVILLLIQFIGMVFHQYSTLLHVAAATEIFENKMEMEELQKQEEDLIWKEYLRLQKHTKTTKQRIDLIITSEELAHKTTKSLSPIKKKDAKERIRLKSMKETTRFSAGDSEVSNSFVSGAIISRRRTSVV